MLMPLILQDFGERLTRTYPSLDVRVRKPSHCSSVNNACWLVVRWNTFVIAEIDANIDDTIFAAAFHISTDKLDSIDRRYCVDVHLENINYDIADPHHADRFLADVHRYCEMHGII